MPRIRVHIAAVIAASLIAAGQLAACTQASGERSSPQDAAPQPAPSETAGSSEAAGPAETAGERQLVRSLERIRVDKQDHGPRISTLRIAAEGSVTTGGWQDAKLEDDAYDLSPAGYVRLRFTAQPPDGMATQAISRVRDVTAVIVDPRAFNGIKIRTAAGITRIPYPGRHYIETEAPEN